MMKKVDWLNLIERAAWTFVEAALGTLPAVIPLDLDKPALVSMAIAAVAAGLSAVKTLILEIARQHNKKAVEVEEVAVEDPEEDK